MFGLAYGAPHASLAALSIKIRPARVKLLFRSRNRTSQEDRVKLISTSPPPDFEQDVLPRFQTRNSAPVLRDRRNGRVIDFGDDVATGESNVLCKACRIDLCNQHALHILEPGAACAIGSEIFDTQPEFDGGRSAIATGPVRRAVRENLCTIRDGQAGFMLFLVADISDTDAVADRCGGNRIYQVAARVDRLPLYTSDDLAWTQPCLLRWAA